MTDVGGFEKHQRLVGQLLVHLRRVILVVETDATMIDGCDRRRETSAAARRNLIAGLVVAEDVAASQ